MSLEGGRIQRVAEGSPGAASGGQVPWRLGLAAKSGRRSPARRSLATSPSYQSSSGRGRSGAGATGVIPACSILLAIGATDEARALRRVDARSQPYRIRGRVRVRAVGRKVDEDVSEGYDSTPPHQRKVALQDALRATSAGPATRRRLDEDGSRGRSPASIPPRRDADGRSADCG